MKEELLRERLEEARSTYKLNLGYARTATAANST